MSNRNVHPRRMGEQGWETVGQDTIVDPAVKPEGSVGSNAFVKVYVKARERGEGNKDIFEALDRSSSRCL